MPAALDWPNTLRVMQGPECRDRDIAHWQLLQDALAHPAELTPMQFAAPTTEVYGVIASAGDEKRLPMLMSDPATARAYGAFREATTFTEAVNSRKLERLAWCHGQCGRMAAKHPDIASRFDELARKFEGIAIDHWGLSSLSEKRGWAMEACRNLHLLPIKARYLSGAAP